MGEIIASLDGYLYSPGHNFNWKPSEAFRVLRSARDLTALEVKEFGDNLLLWE
jgi:hypothetical protein